MDVYPKYHLKHKSKVKIKDSAQYVKSKIDKIIFISFIFVLTADFLDSLVTYIFIPDPSFEGNPVARFFMINSGIEIGLIIVYVRDLLIITPLYILISKIPVLNILLAFIFFCLGFLSITEGAMSWLK